MNYGVELCNSYKKTVYTHSFDNRISELTLGYAPSLVVTVIGDLSGFDYSGIYDWHSWNQGFVIEYQNGRITFNQWKFLSRKGMSNQGKPW